MGFLYKDLVEMETMGRMDIARADFLFGLIIFTSVFSIFYYYLSTDWEIFSPFFFILFFKPFLLYPSFDSIIRNILISFVMGLRFVLSTM